MTTSRLHPPRNPDAPAVELATTVLAAAGAPADIPVRIVHHGRRPARLRVTLLGLDSRWVPEPLDLGVMQPGDVISVTLTILPERGALGARYPFTVAAEVTAEGGGGKPVIGLAESVLAVDSAERISMAVRPATPHAVFGRTITVDISNPGGEDRTLTLVPSAAAGASLRLRRESVEVPAQQTVSVKGKLRITKPSLMGGENTHTFAVAAQGVGAPEYIESAVRSKPLISHMTRNIIGVALIAAVWIAAAIVFIPKISDSFKPDSVASPNTQTESGPVAGDEGGSPDSGSAGNGGNGSGNGATGSGGAGSGESGGPGNAGSGGPGDAGNSDGNSAGYQLTGTVTGSGAVGALVTLAPKSLGSPGDTGSLPAAEPAGQATAAAAAFRRDAGAATGPIGKVRGPLPAIDRNGFATITKLTNDKGQFAFSGITAPGFYLLTIAKKGYQTQRFLIDSENLASPQPMKVVLVPGRGSLSGKVVGPGGAPVGAATIMITDGDVTLQTSSVSPTAGVGTPGTWSMTNLSTPGTYLVTATAPGFGGASMLVSLQARGSATANLTLVPGAGSIVGMVSGKNELGATGGLGGITVIAKGGDTTRTATTVTSEAMRGSYILPNLPSPGEYTLTISGDGFLTQTRDVRMGAGVGSVTVNATLSRSNSVVQGMVTGLDADGKPEGGLGGVGLSLASNTLTMKTMTTSGDSAGSYQFTGVPPGTYVLTAVQFGRAAASATVEVTASTAKTIDLQLAADIGSELPATAHIRGQVTDSRTGGPLTCDRAVEAVAPSDCVATVTVTAPVDPTDPSQGTRTYSVQATSALNFVYTVPSLDDPDHVGLPPGLYTVNISAPGYEDSVTHVQVAQGQTTPAPPTSLPVLGLISGTVTTRVGQTAKPSCVLAVPVSVTLPEKLPTSCAVATDGATCTAAGIPGAQPCAYTSMGNEGEGPVGTYAIRGLTHGRYHMLLLPQDPEYLYVTGAAPVVTLPLGSDGQFNAVLDRLGRIDLTVLKIDPNTSTLVPVKDAALTIATYPGGSASPAGVTTDSTGNAIITGLEGRYVVTATATVQPLGGGQPEKVTVSGTSEQTGLNQTVNMTLVIAKLSGPIIGRVTANIGANVPVPVPGADVAITGTVAFQGGTSSNGQGAVTTDGNGCYAIVPVGWDPSKNSELTSPACGVPVDPGSIARMMDLGSGDEATLISDTITVAVGSTWTTLASVPPSLWKVTEPYPATGDTVVDCPTDSNGTLCGNDKARVIEAIPVAAAPLLVEPTLDVVGPLRFSAPDLSAATSPVHISVVSKPTLAGTVTLAPTSGDNWTRRLYTPTIPSTWCTNSTGSIAVPADCYWVPLTFFDSNLSGDGQAMPGTYQFSVTVDGFNPITINLLCQFGEPTCAFRSTGTPGNTIRLSVMRKPELRVDISLPVTNGQHASDPWEHATADQTVGTSLGGLKVVGDTASDDGSGTVTTLNAHLTFDNDDVVLAPKAGDYTFEISKVKGYNGATTITVSCGADFTHPCTTSATEAAAYPTFDTAGSTVALDDDTAPNGTVFAFSDITATVVRNPGNDITVSVQEPFSPATVGNVTWSDSTPGLLAGQVVPRTYTVTFSLPGFKDSGPITVDCTSSSGCSTAAITLEQLPEASGTITIPLAPGASTVAIPANAVTVTSPSGSPVKVTMGAPSYSTDGSGNKIATSELTWFDGDVGFDGLVPAVDYAIRIAIPGYVTKTVACDARAGNCDASATLELNPHPGMKLVILPDNDTNKVPAISVDNGTGNVSLTSDIDGNLTWSQDGPDGVVTPRGTTTDPDPYVIRAQLDGYQMSFGGDAASKVLFKCPTDGTCTFPTITLVKDTDLKIVVMGSDGSTANAADFVLKRDTTTIGSPSTLVGTAEFDDQSTTSLDTSNSDSTQWADTSYTLSVKAAGYQFASGAAVLTSGSMGSVSCTNGSVTLTGLQLIPGGTTTCTVTLDKLGSIVGTTAWQKYALDGTTDIGTEELGGVDLTAQRLDVTTSGSPAVSTGTLAGDQFSATSLTHGSYTLTGDVGNEGLADGTYLVTASKTGLATAAGLVKINGGVLTAAVGDVTVGGTAYHPLTLGGTSLPLVLIPDTVNLDVAFEKKNGNPTSVPNAEISITDTATSATVWRCTVASGAATPDPASVCSLDGSGSGKKIVFASVPPGDYTLDIAFTDSKYNNIVDKAVTVDPTGSAHSETIKLAQRINTVAGYVKDSAGNVVENATVKLCDATLCPAKDYDGVTGTMSMKSETTADQDPGKFTFDNVADGTYYLLVTHDGYADETTGNFTIDFDTTNSPLHNVTLDAAKRQTLSMTFTGAPTGLNLAGASVTLTQTANPRGTGANPPPTLTASNITGSGNGTADPYKSTLNQVPTGTYDVTVAVNSTAAPYDFSAGPVTVTEGSDTQNESLTVQAAEVPLTVSWSTSSCVAAPSSTIPLNFKQSSEDWGDSTSISTNAPSSGDTSASATIYLPPGNYDWYPTSSPTDWSTTLSPTNPLTFSVSGSTTPTNGVFTSLTATSAPLTVTVKVAGDPYEGAALSAAATDSENNPLSATGTDNGDGTYSFCLAGSGTGDVIWTITATEKAGDTSPFINMSTQTTVSGGVASPASGSMNGHSISPAVELAGTEAGHNTVKANLSITDSGGTVLWSDANNPVSIGTSNWTQEFVFGQDAGYKFKAGVDSLTTAADDWSTSATAIVFNSPLSGGGTAPSITITYTEPNSGGTTTTSATATVNSSSGSTAFEGATVSYQPSAGTAQTCTSSTSKTTTDVNGTLECAGLDTSTDYTFTATYQDADGNTWTSDSKSLETAVDASDPNTVPALTLTPETTSVKLHFDAAAGAPDVPDGTTVTLTGAGAEEFSAATADGSVIVSGLGPNTEYTVSASYTESNVTYSVPAETKVTSPESGTDDQTGSAITLTTS